ncbi:MAG: hypothetical protein ABEN55_06025, partial [Bradymonadaceae bacterium]
MFNLGLISEKVGKLKRARKYYKKFTEAPGVELKDRERASKRLKTINEILASSETEQQAKETAKQRTDLTNALEAMEAGLEETEEQPKDQPSKGEGEEKKAETEQTDGTEEGGGETKTAGPSDGTEETDTGEDQERPEIAYKWPVYASFGTALAALSGGTVSLMLAQDRADKSRQADGNNQSKHRQYESQATTFATSATGLFVGGAVLTGVGAFFVIKQSIED